MQTMNVSLTPALIKMVQDKVESGLYGNASEVIRDAIRQMGEYDMLVRNGRMARHERAPMHEPALPSLADKTKRATNAFIQKISDRYLLQKAYLFGSHARGTHHTDSDVDIAVILKGKTGDRSATGREMSGIAFDIMLDTGVRIGPLPLWENEFDQPDSFSNPELIRNIQLEGIRL